MSSWVLIKAHGRAAVVFSVQPRGILFESCFTIVFKCKALWPNLKYSWEKTLFPILKNTWNLQKILLHAEMDWQLPNWREEAACYN